MSATLELVDDAAQFFAPVAADVIDGLIGQYRVMRARVERVAEFMGGADVAGAFGYFESAAQKREQHLSRASLGGLFSRESAIAELNAAHWSKAMHMTDVLDCMPQKRRDEWHAQISNPLGRKAHHNAKTFEVEPIPEFTEEAVRSTILGLLAMREKFFAERVDGIFQGLSKTHITNAPEGFGRRMILAGVDSFFSGDSKLGLINDLRCIIARFMGRDEPGHGATKPLVDYAKTHKRGEWVSVDGGALRIRCYGIGTAHVEVHPDMAWRLNAVLAQLYPAAIPSQFRQKPKRATKAHQLISQPLPFAAIAQMREFTPARDLNPDREFVRADKYLMVPGCWEIASLAGGVVADQIDSVMRSIGGTPAACKHAGKRWAFDYDPTMVVKEIMASGCVPEQKSHQFYPTPLVLAERLVEFAEIGPRDMVLEPSAGTGGLADLLRKDRTTCVEVSPLHCKVLKAKGYAVTQGDFLEWEKHTRDRFDRIVMNPPFSDGRWQAHLQAAAFLLAPAGLLAAILPSGAKTRAVDLLPGFDLEFQGPFDNQFPGASVSVVMLRARRRAAF